MTAPPSIATGKIDGKFGLKWRGGVKGGRGGTDSQVEKGGVEGTQLNYCDRGDDAMNKRFSE